MSTMTDTLRHEESLFIPSEDTEVRDEYVPKVAGEYLGHITSTKTVVREFTRDKRQVKAHIYNFKVRVAPENVEKKYTVQGRDGSHKEIDGSHFVEWEIIADGVFRYLEPKDDDTFESYTEGNKKYFMFCQSIGMEIKTEERTVNGKTVRVQLLPEIKETELNGTPVTAVVGRGQDWTDDTGKTKPSWRVKFTKLWTDGKRLATTTTNDLPF